MGRVLAFPPPALAVRREQLRRLIRAKQLVFEAAELLGGMGEGGARVAWLLEDCVELLEHDRLSAAGRPEAVSPGGVSHEVRNQ